MRENEALQAMTKEELISLITLYSKNWLAMDLSLIHISCRASGCLHFLLPYRDIDAILTSSLNIQRYLREFASSLLPINTKLVATGHYFHLNAYFRTIRSINQ